MITYRDAKMITWLIDFKAAHTSALQLFYPSYDVTARRLKMLTTMREIGRERDGWNGQYIYYKHKPKQLRHAVLLTDFYRELYKISDIKRFIIEPTFDKIRPDAVCGFVQDGINRLALIEVVISNNNDCKKYDTFQWQKHFPIQPELIIISDKQMTVNGYKVTNIMTNMEGIKL